MPDLTPKRTDTACCVNMSSSSVILQFDQLLLHEVIIVKDSYVSGERIAEKVELGRIQLRKIQFDL